MYFNIRLLLVPFFKYKKKNEKRLVKRVILVNYLVNRKGLVSFKY